MQHFKRELHHDARSAFLEVIEFSNLPFLPQRVYWMYNFVSETTRGNHAHKSLRQLFILIQGTVHLEISDESSSQTFILNQDSNHLFLESGFWRVIRQASHDAILMVLADQPYDEDDYIRDWDEFLNWRKNIE